MRAPRLLVGSLVAGLLALTVSVGIVVPPAAAAVLALPVIPVDGPGMLNVLPSTVVGATKGYLSSSPIANSNALLLSTFFKNPKDAVALMAKMQGTATAAQEAIATAEAARFAVPATKPAGFLKTIGGSNVAVIGFTGGLMAGQLGVRAFGFKDEQVCAENNGILTAISSVTNGVDCNAWQNTIDEANRNLDAPMDISSPAHCNTAGKCMSIASGGVKLVGTSQTMVYCGTPSGSHVAGTSLDISAKTSVGGNGAYSGQPSASFARCPAGQLTIWGPAAGTTITCFAVTPFAGNLCSGGSTGVNVSATRTDPSRTFECKLTDTTGQTYTSTGAPWKETDTKLDALKCPALPSGKTLARSVVTQKTIGGGGTDAVLQDQTTTPEYQAWKQNYPDCGSGLCMLDLRQIIKDKSCHELGTECADWLEDPEQATKYECRYGTHVVAIKECFAYGPMFKPGAKETGTALGDPETGNPVEVKTSIPADVKEFGDPIKDPEKSRECMPTGWGLLNPVEWVMKPVGCALEKAFVPRASHIKAWQNQWKERVNSSSLGTAGRVIAPLMQMPGGGNGCSGLPLPLEFFGGSWEGRLFAACDEPMRGVAATVNGMLVFLIISGGALAVVRYVANIVGYSGYGQQGSNEQESRVKFK